MLNIGDTAPSFELPDQVGNDVSLSALINSGALVLYFYPADFSPVCTAEACAFRDVYDDLAKIEVQVVGISPQSRESHQRFATRFSLPFPLLFDASKRVIRVYGVDGPLGFGVRRATFLIGRDGRIENRVLSDFFVGSHINMIKQVLDR
jgi:peroxiredoxin Q/BCP